ncbi:MAG: hypothetical protein GF317_19550 [Candidatus Lokiarchaeota archaeon]|nr:hypothetical protein [Candidatus Lokiarchaeota archaeon]MBD3201692.1 hypothetical protein [Candidatus Lokiarchaeota archaeon]
MNSNTAGENSNDDYLHEPDERDKWREAYYFNWVDLDNKVSGFSTLAILPNIMKREFVFLLYYNNHTEAYYREPDLESYDADISSMLIDKRLKYSMVKPLEKWRIEYKSRKLSFDITFENRYPLYYFGKDSSASWHRHFEASGKIEGTLKLKNNTEFKIKGFGQRDKSWGYRDWHQFDKWFAGHFQFENWTCGFRKDYVNGKVDLSGYIGREQQNNQLSSMEIDVKYDSDAFNSPLETIYTFSDIKGNKFRIKAKRIGKKSFMRFARDFDKGYTELFEQMVIMKDLDSGEIGSGMSEQLRTVLS